MNDTLLTDKYQFAMNAAYLQDNKDGIATFDMFIRKLPQDWGYYIACGIDEALDYITNIKFSEGDIAYLREENFSEEYLEFLRSFAFKGDVWAVKEGTPVFPNQPIVRVTANRTQAQFVETALLNIINFNTMIASKASRIVTTASPAFVADFGLRRAQGGDAGLKASRACYMSGCFATSNVLAGKTYKIPIFGTMAHSFVMSYEEELDAFRAFTNTFPNKTTLLIDTYDTIQGAKNAVIVAKELRIKGGQLGAVRLDSGNLYELSIKVRKILDGEGLDYVKIVVSSDLDEYKIKRLKEADVISTYGVGTEMVTGKPVAAIPGVYKLVDDEDLGGRIKLSEGKQTLPGKKQIYRQFSNNGIMEKDILSLCNESIENSSMEKLLYKAIEKGKNIRGALPISYTRAYCLSQIAALPNYLKETKVRKQYPIEHSEGLKNLVKVLTKKYRR